LGARVRRTPQGAQFGLVLKELRQLSKEHLQKLLRRHRSAVRVPEGCRHHVLNSACLAVGEFHLDPLRPRGRFRTRLRQVGWVAGWKLPRLLGLRLNRFTIPLWIVEVMMRL